MRGTSDTSSRRRRNGMEDSESGMTPSPSPPVVARKRTRKSPLCFSLGCFLLTLLLAVFVYAILHDKDPLQKKRPGIISSTKNIHPRPPDLTDVTSYKIPNVLIFTHYTNLLTSLETIKDPRLPQHREEVALAVNVQHSINVHNTTTTGDDLKVFFWTDKECIESLRRTFPDLIPYFQQEKEGMYRGDICRGSALYEHGGIYLDVDVGIRHNLWENLNPETEFFTTKVHSKSNWDGFFQAIIGAAPSSPVLKRYLELFYQHYEGITPIRKGPLGVQLLKTAWRQITKQEEIVTELYQELLYRPEGAMNTGKNKGNIVPAPTWGTRRACHFLVAGAANRKDRAEVVIQAPPKHGEPQPVHLVVPAVSRIPGSRMCATPEEDNPNDTAATTISMEDLLSSMEWWKRTS